MHANCNEAQAGVVRVTRLSTTAASVEFTYLYKPRQSLVIETNGSLPGPVNISTSTEYFSEAQVFYDYHFVGLTPSQSDYCFRVAVISGGAQSVFMNSSFVCICSNTVTQRSNEGVCVCVCVCVCVWEDWVLVARYI